jgi:hypothetical protein
VSVRSQIDKRVKLTTIVADATKTCAVEMVFVKEEARRNVPSVY